jgi:hypothetical protein
MQMLGLPLASALHSVIISTSDFGGHYFEFSGWPTSGNVDSVISKSCIAENM